MEVLFDRKRGKDADLAHFVLDRRQIRSASYSSRRRYSCVILALFASREPRDWQNPDVKVIKDVYY